MLGATAGETYLFLAGNNSFTLSTGEDQSLVNQVNLFHSQVQLHDQS